MHNNPFTTCPKDDKKSKKQCSCQHDRPVKNDSQKKKPLEKLTTVNNIRLT